MKKKIKMTRCGIYIKRSSGFNKNFTISYSWCLNLGSYFRAIKNGEIK